MPAVQLLCQFGLRLLGHVSTREGEGYGGGESGQRAKWLGRSTATWWVTTSAKSVELPHGPINIPLPLKVDTHTPHFRDSTYKAPILSVVARRSLVWRVVRI
jgi:hypothetical protein